MSDSGAPRPDLLVSPSGLDRTAEAAARQDAGPLIERGQRVGRYEITEELGAGGMGVVLLAVDTSLHRKVALKLIKARTNDLKLLTRFEREAVAMAKLSHPNVVAVHDYGVHQGQPFLVMELVEGISLREWLAQRARPWWETVSLLGAAAQGLKAAHDAGIVHRDFKPDNVLVATNGRVAVTDFGLARSLEEGDPEGRPLAAGAASALQLSVTNPHAVMGTPLYMAPEQFAGEPTDARTDLFAFGVVLYEAVYGQRPFPINASPTEPISLDSMRAEVSSGQLRPPPRARKVPARLHALIVQLLQPKPSARCASMAEVLERLAPFARPPRSYRSVAVGVGLVLGLAIAGAALYREAPTEQQWFLKEQRNCNGLSVAVALHEHPPPQTPLGEAYAATCLALAGKTVEADQRIAALAQVSDRKRAAEVLFDLADPIADRGDNVSAAPLMALVLKYHPDHFQALFHLGMSEAALGKPDEARIHLQRFLGIYQQNDHFREEAVATFDKLNLLH